MLREDKIRLMHEIAKYEKSADEWERPAKEYFRGDYIGMHLLQSFLSFTLSYALILGIVSLYHLEHILNAVNVLIVFRFVLRCVVAYVVGLLLFEILPYIVFRRRYDKSAARRTEHLRCLNRLKKRYDTEERIKELAKEEGANA